VQYNDTCPQGQSQNIPLCTTTCISNWANQGWSQCINGTQTEIWVDTANCGKNTTIPISAIRNCLVNLPPSNPINLILIGGISGGAGLIGIILLLMKRK